MFVKTTSILKILDPPLITSHTYLILVMFYPRAKKYLPTPMYYITILIYRYKVEIFFFCCLKIQFILHKKDLFMMYLRSHHQNVFELIVLSFHLATLLMLQSIFLKVQLAYTVVLTSFFKKVIKLIYVSYND